MTTEPTKEPISDGGSAFPYTIQENSMSGAKGMSLRDWFAGQALAGLLSWDQVNLRADVRYMTAEMAYELADAMLEARNLRR